MGKTEGGLVMPEARKREPVVPAKMKVVIKELLDQRVYDLAAAATKAGLSTYLTRRYLKRPNVLRYLREERAAMLEEVCAGNAAALALVRATSDNGMAVTAACRQLETMRQTVAWEAGGVQVTRPASWSSSRPPTAECCNPCRPRPRRRCSSSTIRSGMIWNCRAGRR
jgi:hypothetical protein